MAQRTWHPDADKIRAMLKRQRISAVYHFSAVDNLGLIFREGALLSKRTLQEKRAYDDLKASILVKKVLETLAARTEVVFDLPFSEHRDSDEENSLGASLLSDRYYSFWGIPEQRRPKGRYPNGFDNSGNLDI